MHSDAQSSSSTASGMHSDETYLGVGRGREG